MAKKIELEEHGNFLYGSLDGVDFVASGKLENGTAYGASVKLKFITKIDVVKNVQGTEIKTKKAISQIIKLPTTDEQLALMVHKYNELIGKDLLLSYSTADNNIFQMQSDVSVKVVGEK